ncbi:chemotaxis protein CheW [Pseudothauera nasutitermitis]|uniref:Chemotaxis protein CheW n=1 Tax=Pseudothauera nasutitermitis TaxID=2565930 RepID=A0A4S4B1S7_9RHOO|nr:chemotaxis protein CheW [Pseudothauera nasutitermitis]THF66504.1 chemotaxis protein CheW [Pseudothauera nasutitermitis]
MFDAEPAADRDDTPSATAREFIAFALADEMYAVDILSVREIRAHEPATRIAGAPPVVRGVINLRGVIVPVVDLRLHLGLGAAQVGPATVIVVLQIDERLVGVQVDALADVVALEPAAIRPAPEFGAGIRHVRGLAEVEGQTLVVLDIEALMCSPELALFAGGPERGGT